MEIVLVGFKIPAQEAQITEAHQHRYCIMVISVDHLIAREQATQIIILTPRSKSTYPKSLGRKFNNEVTNL